MKYCSTAGRASRPDGECRDHVQAARFERSDHAVVVRGIAGQQVRTHQQQADGAALAFAWQRSGVFAHAFMPCGVIDADLGVLHRRLRFDCAAQHGARPVGIALDQEAQQVGDVVFRTREPVLQHQEIGAHVLRGAGNEAQELRDAAQHRHLRGTAGGRLGAAIEFGLAGAAQALEQCHRAAGLAVHRELADAGQLHHFAGRHRADHRVAVVAPRLQRSQHRQEVLFHEEHRRDHDVGAGDVVLAGLQRGTVFAPFARGVHREDEARQFAQQALLGAHRRAGNVAVQRHESDANRCAR